MLTSPIKFLTILPIYLSLYFRFGRKITFLVSVVLISATTFITAWVDNYYVFVVLRFFTGLLQQVLSTATFSVVFLCNLIRLVVNDCYSFVRPLYYPGLCSPANCSLLLIVPLQVNKLELLQM